MSATILLVEDDDAARLALGNVLKLAGYTVSGVETGQQAIRALTQHSFDIVISDMRLPDIDGIEILRTAMRQNNKPSVVLLTGYGTLDTAIAALREGASDYLLKPCPPHALLEGVQNAYQKRMASLRQADAIKNLAQGVAQIQQQILTMGVLTTDSSHQLVHSISIAESANDSVVVGNLQVGQFPHETRYQNQPLHLTPIEHALLRRLAEANGQVVRYSDIINRTHGYSTDDAEAQMLLKSHVRNIRRKIGADVILNVRNVGYRLTDE